MSKNRWAVLTRIYGQAGDTWENANMEYDEATETETPITFATRREAREDLREHLASMVNAGMEFSRRDWRVGKLEC